MFYAIWFLEWEIVLHYHLAFILHCSALSTLFMYMWILLHAVDPVTEKLFLSNLGENQTLF